MEERDFLKSIKEWDIDFLTGITDIENPLFVDLGKVKDDDIHRDDDIVPETMWERISLFNQVLDNRWACVQFQYGEHEYCVWFAARDGRSMFISFALDPITDLWQPSPISVMSTSNDFTFKRTSSKIEAVLPLTDANRERVLSLTMLPVALASEKVTN